MALSARPIGTSATPNIASAHMPAGGRNVATATFSPIEEIAAKAEVFADPNFNFQGFAKYMRGQNEDRQPPRNQTSNFDTNSTTFVHLLSQQQRDVEIAKSSGGNSGVYSQIVLKKAVHAYETTAQTISGVPKSLGTSVSYSL